MSVYGTLMLGSVPSGHHGIKRRNQRRIDSGKSLLSFHIAAVANFVYK